MTRETVLAESSLAPLPGETLTPRQLVALYLVLAPLPGGRWLRRLVRRHPAQATALREASRVWVQAGSKQRALRQLALPR
jgi:hypothetical protein